MTNDRAAPTAPLMLGVAGLIPFVALSVLLLTGWGALFGCTPEFVHAALATYAALIVSFLGGIRWGLAVAVTDQSLTQQDYAISVVPSLLAWGALALPEPWDLRALAALTIGLGFLDQNLVRRGEAPAWFGWLRLTPSAGACVALLLGA